MDNTLYLTKLFDYYESLLTDKQKKYFIDYYIENLSLSEISENYNISRNAVHKQIKDVESKLIFYEDKLKLSEKESKIKKILEKISDSKIKEEIEELI